MLAIVETAYSVHVVSLAIGVIIGAVIMHYESKASKADGKREGFDDAWRLSGSRRDAEMRYVEKSIERETRIWQDRVHDLKNALHPEKLDKSSEAREARKRGGKGGGSDS